MNVSEQIIQVIDALCDKFGIAMDWTGENVIPYVEILCKKLVTYEICTSVAWIVIAVIAIMCSVIVAKKIYTELTSGEYFDEFLSVLILTIIIFIIVGSVTAFITQIFDVIKCVTFPEMHVFEYIQGIMNAQ